MNTTNNKYSKSHKIIVKTIIGFLIAIIAFPLLFVIGYTNLTGKIVSYIFYSFLITYSMYEFIRIFAFKKWVNFYVSGLILVATLFPLQELIEWFKSSDNKALQELIKLQYSLKFYYPGLGYLIFTCLLLLPFCFLKFEKNKVYMYLAIILGFYVLLITGKSLVYATHENLWFVIVIFCASIFSDSFAYFGGMLFGNKFFKRKLAPKTSPNKTIEGAIVGYIASFILLFFAFYFGKWNLNFPWWLKDIIIPIVLPIVAIFGDLVFSFIKRFVDIKDFANFIPGHGGILDRIDSIIITSFVFLPLLII